MNYFAFCHSLLNEYDDDDDDDDDDLNHVTPGLELGLQQSWVSFALCE